MAVKIGMVSLGCEKNRVDGEMMLAALSKKGYKLVADVAMADVAVVNTCGFIESAKQESIDEILELAKLKAEGKIKAIVVTGCLAERYQKEILKELPEADGVVGIGGNGDIALVIERVLAGDKTELFPDKLSLPLSGDRVQTTPAYFSYLKVADGCDNRCTYCAIPLIRGPFRSRSVESLVEEAKTLAARGVKELNVIAQDTTRYGEDNYGKLMLPALLKELCKIDGLCWIRLLYCYPERITDELIDVMAREEKIVKYMDIPLQHCDKEVLRRMNRRGDRESLLALMQKLRENIPGITLRTTFIVGFPGETEEQFTQLAQFNREVGFDRMGCFAYSQEEGTPAASFPHQIDEDVKTSRQALLMEEQMGLMQKRNEEKIGRKITVLCEGFDRYAECFFGRSAADAPDVDPKVFFTAAGDKPRPGEFVTVEITDAMDCDLIGEMTGRC